VPHFFKNKREKIDMDAKFIVWDQISLHGATPKETFNIVREYFPEISDEELNVLIQEEVKKKAGNG
jgi:hypothetical protein